MFSGLFLFLNIGSSEMIFIVFIALLLFGGKKLPELARGLGRGIRDFKDASESIKRDISDQINNFEKDLDENEAVDERQSSSPTEQPKLDQQVELREGNNDDIAHSDKYYHNYDYSDPDQPSISDKKIDDPSTPST